MTDDEYESDAMKAIKTTHGKIEDAIQEHVTALQIDGVLTGWSVVVSLASVQEDDEFDALYRTQSDGLSKWAHIGMLTSALESEKTQGVFSD